MAKLTIECLESGDIQYKLRFMGINFYLIMMGNEFGAASDRPALENQVKKELGESLENLLGQQETEELLERISEIGDLNDVDSMNEIVIFLNECEGMVLREARN